MATVAKSFRIKTGKDTFSDEINFLSTSVYTPDGKNLDTKLIEINDTISDNQTALTSAINTEKQARESADLVLTTNLQTEQTARAEKDGELTNAINAEIADRKDEIARLEGVISTAVEEEAGNRAEIIQTLENNLQTEINNRISEVRALRYSRGYNRMASRKLNGTSDTP